jgi:tetratricopeptide (TPR) repeat protein
MCGRLRMVILVLSLILPGTIMAGGLDYTFEQGNQHYINGEYDQAVAEYEKIVAAGYQSPELYYNLGNAYFREGQLGRAIMNFIRARRLAPRDDDILANLQFARQYTIDKIEVTQQTILLDYINKFFDSFSLSEITWVAAILYVLTALIVIFRFVYLRLHIPTAVFLTVLGLFVVAAVFTAVKVDRDMLTRQGVVLAQQAEVRSGPGQDFSAKFTAHAGLTFNIEREESEYYWVNFENRLKGWIPKSVAAEI